MAKKVATKNTRTNTKKRTVSKKSNQSWWEKQKVLLFVVGFAFVATLLVIPSLAKTPAVKELEATQKGELRSLRERHEKAEDTLDEQCDALSGSQEDTCEENLKILKDENEREEDDMKARHKTALKTLKASQGANTSGTNNNQGSGTGSAGGGSGQAGQQGTNGGAGGAGGSGSCTGNCSGAGGSNGTGSSGSGGTSNPGTSSPGTPGQPGGSTAPASSGGGSASPAAYSVRIRTAGAGNRCLDVNGGGIANGTSVQLWDCHGGTNQQWIASSGTLRSVHSGRCLDEDALAAGRNGARIQIWDCHDGPNQKWDGSSNNTGSRLASRASRLCLDADSLTNGANGTKIQTWACHDGLNQRWIP